MVPWHWCGIGQSVIFQNFPFQTFFPLDHENIYFFFLFSLSLLISSLQLKHLSLGGESLNVNNYEFFYKCMYFLNVSIQILPLIFQKD